MDTCSIAVVSAIAAIAKGTVQTLESLGFVHNPEASIVVVLDAPYGYAMNYLASNSASPHHMIVATGNLSPEYCASLADYAPAIFLAGPDLGEELVAAIPAAARGERYHISHAPPSRLSVAQRHVLRHLAAGKSDQQIAQALSLSVKRVRNMLSEIYSLLGCTSRLTAVLNYWGSWYHLPGEGHLPR